MMIASAGELASTNSTGVWPFLLNMLCLLGAAALLGTLAERFRQSAIVGYMVAGMLLGPSMLNWVANQQEVFVIAEFGVMLLLFSIGLDFSGQQLLRLGRRVLLGGILQISMTFLIGAGLSWLIRLPPREAIVIGAMAALSSTACVLRLLMDRAELESEHGRCSLGILLVQDIAVVPLMLIVTAMQVHTEMWLIITGFLYSCLVAIFLAGLFYMVFNHVMPRVLALSTLRRNRDLPVLLAVVMVGGSAWAAHRLHMSPALGAFAAGVLLAVSPFATQIRADLQPLRAVMVCLFFTAIGMFGDPQWIINNVWIVTIAALAILLGKGLLTAAALRICGFELSIAVPTSLCLAQIGEFSFVLATIALGTSAGNASLSEASFRAFVSAAIITLLLTPLLVSRASHIGLHAGLRRISSSSFDRLGALQHPETTQEQMGPGRLTRGSNAPVFLIGFGPAGQRTARDLQSDLSHQIVVIDRNPANVHLARQWGLRGFVGDATQTDILHHVQLPAAAIVVNTIPAPPIARHVTQLARQLAPNARIIVRSRYDLHQDQLRAAGADTVVNEEEEVGSQLAREVRAAIQSRGI